MQAHTTGEKRRRRREEEEKGKIGKLWDR